MDDVYKEVHESYGMLRISRSSGHDKILFGSSIPHHNTILLSIHPGVIERGLNHDHYYSRQKPYIEIEMSQSQFAEAITSMNMGSGVPVTIREKDGQIMDNPDYINKRMQFEQEFKQKMQTMEARISRLTESTEEMLANKKSLTKSDRNAILNELNALKRELASNIPFIATSFGEQMDKTAQEAKAEVEAFTINKLNQLGMEKLDELRNRGELPGTSRIHQIEQE
ncbi:hypothetical protein [Metabacillus sp. SLBN-84]